VRRTAPKQHQHQHRTRTQVVSVAVQHLPGRSATSLACPATLTPVDVIVASQAAADLRLAARLRLLLLRRCQLPRCRRSGAAQLRAACCCWHHASCLRLLLLAPLQRRLPLGKHDWRGCAHNRAAANRRRGRCPKRGRMVGGAGALARGVREQCTRAAVLWLSKTTACYTSAAGPATPSRASPQGCAQCVVGPSPPPHVNTPAAAAAKQPSEEEEDGAARRPARQRRRSAGAATRGGALCSSPSSHGWRRGPGSCS
jgi:hypothetical protein